MFYVRVVLLPVRGYFVTLPKVFPDWEHPVVKALFGADKIKEPNFKSINQHHKQVVKYSDVDLEMKDFDSALKVVFKGKLK